MRGELDAGYRMPDGRMNAGYRMPRWIQDTGLHRLQVAGCKDQAEAWGFNPKL